MFSITMKDNQNHLHNTINILIYCFIGATSTITIQLDRNIGDLLQINLQNYDNDGWIFTTFICQLNQIKYHFQVQKPYQWLQNYNKNLDLLYENGFEPYEQVDYQSTDNMILNIFNQVFIYTPTGILEDYSLN